MVSKNLRTTPKTKDDWRYCTNFAQRNAKLKQESFNIPMEGEMFGHVADIVHAHHTGPICDGGLQQGMANMDQPAV
ncbi:hypothetical protein SARC_10162 [Sphaeroforma arctica JP610]|uniref:Uncharacterized protein n=1 Tax=Sphaeroforma arctica JP610 TaxID=667725 RepID=A0A0L0FKS3_9EUKA|nr:hypothetical protein SARC_10162 [Sphaeroforma arctica JP610]KNC77375.1 hypothetical protein SARC_10162 [Sphaeroforma arctica JP610]|eukprot:XP_014151277.1 hypothetical protein SARC_10162 [Sphaeroforma arctica JP610]